MSVIKAKTVVNLYRFFEFFVSDDDSTLLSSNNEFACSFRTVLKSCCTDYDFFSLRIEISYLERFNSILFKFSGIPEVSEPVSRN